MEKANKAPTNKQACKKFTRAQTKKRKEKQREIKRKSYYYRKCKSLMKYRSFSNCEDERQRKNNVYKEKEEKQRPEWTWSHT
jgi:hypothetical protein